MIFAVLFVIAFAVGLVTYLLTNKWLSAALVSITLFVLNTLSDTEQIDKAFYTILLGLPVVFCASLFGAYVVELRRGLGVDELAQENEDVSDSPSNTDQTSDTEGIVDSEKNET